MIFAGKQTRYAQGMGATDANGFVVAFPFSIAATNSGTLPRQIWVDAVNGNDSFNGFSPYANFQLNGTGDKFQVGATGQGSSNAAYGPKATFFAAYQLVANNSTNRVGNQIFLAEGQTFSEQPAGGGSTDSMGNRSGYSVQYPFCIQSCDMSDPLNTAKHGRAIGSNRPKLATTVVGSTGQSYSVLTFYFTDTVAPVRGNFAIRGIDFDSGTGDNCGVNFIGNQSNVLIENCRGVGCGIGIGPSFPTSIGINAIIRHCAVYANWTSIAGNRPSGIGSGHTDRMVVEDCVVYHAAWTTTLAAGRNLATFTGKIDNGAGGNGNTVTVQSALVGTIAVGQILWFSGVSRNITAGSGASWTVDGAATTFTGTLGTTDASCPNFYDHGAYASYGSNDQTVYRRNVFTDSAASGISGRGSLLAYHNVLIDNPVQMVAGGSVANTSSYATENPSGVDLNYHHNLLMGSADITIAEIRGQGIAVQNGRPGSRMKNNLFINNPNYAQGNAYPFQVDASANLPSYCELAGNYLYNWTPTLVTQGGGAFNGSQLFTTYDGASTPSPSGGTNPTLYGTNKVWDNTASPYTNAQIYTALQSAGYGSGDKASLMNAMISAPELPWAERVLTVVGGLFSFDFALAS